MTYNLRHIHTYTHSSQVRVNECVALTQLDLFLAGMWWSLCFQLLTRQLP
jgi:hypothetical protein